jgi:hypothetical protein
MSEKPPSEFDGMYFLPSNDENAIEMHFFTLHEQGVPVRPDLYHIAFFDRDENGNPKFDGAFEAVLGDPKAYVMNLIGAETYGCILRKTDTSGKWWDHYLKRALQKIIMIKMKTALESIANN